MSRKRRQSPRDNLEEIQQDEGRLDIDIWEIHTEQCRGFACFEGF
jgi:hypothetical protein